MFGAKKEGAARNYNGIYSLQGIYSFVSETEEVLHNELRTGNTQPGAKAVAYLRPMKRKISQEVQEIYLRSDSALYNKKVVPYCESVLCVFFLRSSLISQVYTIHLRLANVMMIYLLPRLASARHVVFLSLAEGEDDY